MHEEVKFSCEQCVLDVNISSSIPNQVELAIRTRNPQEAGVTRAFDAGNISTRQIPRRLSQPGPACMMDGANNN